jgi:nicotinamidase-related amidase
VLPRAGEDPMSLDPATTALVLIEYQNEFTSDGGALHGAVAEVMDKTNMLANTRKVVDAGRFLTNCCVESTMRTGYENGYQVITLTDCTAATSVPEHENSPA